MTPEPDCARCAHSFDDHTNSLQCRVCPPSVRLGKAEKRECAINVSMYGCYSSGPAVELAAPHSPVMTGTPRLFEVL